MCATPSPRTPWRGANIKAVSEAIGHANISIRLRSYVQVLPEQRREVAAKVSAAFFPEPASRTP